MPFININSCNLYYEREGKREEKREGAKEGSRDPLLLLHGLGSSAEDWEFQRSFFASNYDLITIDLRGHGRSEKPNNCYSIPIFAADVLKFIDELALTSVHVVGVSMGGMVALEAVAGNSGLFKSITVINSIYELKPNGFAQSIKVASRFIIIYLFGMRVFGKLLAKRLFPKKNQGSLRNLFMKRFRRNEKHSYLAILRSMLGWSIKDRLSNIKSPALIISGDRDYTPLSYKEECAALMPDALAILISDSGHATPVDQPEQLNEIIHSFISGVQSRAQSRAQSRSIEESTVS